MSLPRMCALGVLGLLAALMAPSTALAAGEHGRAPSPAPAPSASNRVIVVWEPGTSRGERLDARDEADADFVRTLGDPRFQLVSPEPGQPVGDLLSSLRAEPAVRSALPDGYSTLDATTNDPLFGQLWGLFNSGAGVGGVVGALPGADIDVQAAWDRTRGTPSTVLAILDSGHRFDHPDLAGVTWINPAEPADGVDNDGNGIVDDTRGADFVGSSVDTPTVDGDPTDDDVAFGGHGIHVAGTAAAAGNNGVGITGVAQDARIMPLRVCSYQPSEDQGGVCPDSSQILAINYAGSHGARVANMSLSGSLFRSDVRDALAANPHVLFVAAAGNGGDDGVGDDNDVAPRYPCAYALANVVCVAATNQRDQLASFSNFGDVTVDLGAPGTQTLSAYPASEQRFLDTFEVNDFATRWTSGGFGFGRAPAGDGPLTSFGATDSVGLPPVPFSSHTLTLRTEVPIPAGSGTCTVSGRRFISRGAGGSFSYTVLSGGAGVPGFSNISPADTSGSAMVSFSTDEISGLAGRTLGVRFSYTAGSAPTTANGVWLDDIAFACRAPLSTPPTYDFLQGTSMATPHVAGVAALLFSLKPAASVAEARGALLAGVDPIPALAGKTVTGGRLNAAAALNALVPLPPPPVVPSPPPTVAPPVVTTTPPAVTATRKCVVPRLRGKTLRRAKAALRRAHCRLGRVTKPRARRGRRLPPLVVRASRPRRGAVGAEGARIALTLKVKPVRRARR